MRRVIYLVLIVLASCSPRQIEPALRRGDEIIICGQRFHTGTRVVLWSDAGGYSAYQTALHFPATNPAATVPMNPPYFNDRADRLDADDRAIVQQSGWSLPILQHAVDQLVFHYDNSGTSRECFRTLHDRRGLSIHFMLDLDGTIYQTLDLQERAWHATTSNSRSIGIEIANIGAFDWAGAPQFAQWYKRDFSRRYHLAIPPNASDLLHHIGGERTADFLGRPIRDPLVIAPIQGKLLYQHDFTPQQYTALAHLTAALCTIFPQIKLDAPRDANGTIINHKLDDSALRDYQGLLGHYHIQINKIDPGPAFQWDRMLRDARADMR